MYLTVLVYLWHDLAVRSAAVPDGCRQALAKRPETHPAHPFTKQAKSRYNYIL